MPLRNRVKENKIKFMTKTKNTFLSIFIVFDVFVQILCLNLIHMLVRCLCLHNSKKFVNKSRNETNYRVI